MQKTCNISETVQGYYDGLIGSRIGTFDRYQNKWPWMTLNSWYALLQKRCVLRHPREKFKWRQTHSISGSVILLSRNIRYMRIFAWVPEGSASDSGVVDDNIFGCFGGYFVGNFRVKARIVCNLHSVDKDQQKSPAVAGKPHDAVVKFDTYQNLQLHRGVLPGIARLSCCLSFWCWHWNDSKHQAPFT